jgi:hypothetical protein
MIAAVPPAADAGELAVVRQAAHQSTLSLQVGLFWREGSVLLVATAPLGCVAGVLVVPRWIEQQGPARQGRQA